MNLKGMALSLIQTYTKCPMETVWEKMNCKMAEENYMIIYNIGQIGCEIYYVNRTKEQSE